MPRPESGHALTRLFQIVTLLHFKGAVRLTQADIAAACGISDRQLRRDLKALRAAEVPYDTNKKRGYFLLDGYMPFKPQFSLQEALALLICRESVSGSGQMPFTHSAQTAYAKIALLLPENLRSMIDDPAVQHVGGGKRNYSEAPWGCLADACEKHKTVEIEYYAITNDQLSTRDVDPYGIVWLGGYCHMIAYCRLRRDFRNFSMDGILKAAATGDLFVPMPGFSLKEYLKGAAGPNIGEAVQIALIFDADTARYARRRNWEFDHKLQDEHDGSLRMTGTVRGLKDIRRELLSWGRHVEVIEPLELRQGIADEARAMVEMYGG